MQKYRFTAVFEPQEEGGFTVTVPALPGCVSEGDSFEEAQGNIREAVQSYLGSLIIEGDSTPSIGETREVISPIHISFNPKNIRKPRRPILHA